MASDMERREVAEELRNVFAPYGVPKGGYISLPDVLDAVGIYYDEDVDVNAVTDVKDVSRLADLIDRPTTTLTEDEDGRTCCANCGCAALYMSDATYCPDCGAEVVEDV